MSPTSEMIRQRRDPFDLVTPWFNRMFDEWMRPTDGGRLIQPALDVSEDENHLLVSAELPGLKKQDVNLTIEEGVLTISGEKKTEKTDKGRNYHRVERTYGSFSRSIALPAGVDASTAEAHFVDGVLEIRIPKTEASKPKRLEIK